MLKILILVSDHKRLVLNPDLIIIICSLLQAKYGIITIDQQIKLNIISEKLEILNSSVSIEHCHDMKGTTLVIPRTSHSFFNRP